MQLKQEIGVGFLRDELRAIVALGCGMLFIVFCLLGRSASWITAGQWLLQAGLIWLYVCLCVRRRLALNRANMESPLFPRLGWGNRITILRGGLIALAGGFLFTDLRAWVPALAYSLAAVLDRLDGFLARRNGQASVLGHELDITYDALGLLVAPLLAISLDKLSGTYLLLSLAYYVYRWALQRRRKLGLPVHSLPSNPLRRTLAGFQMGFVAVVLWPLLDPSLTRVAGVAFMLPVLFGFLADWWVVCGRMRPQVYESLQTWAETFFQPGLRVLMLPMLVVSLQYAGDNVDRVLIICGCLMLFGIAGRIGALTLIALLGGDFPAEGFDVIGQMLIFVASWILLLGTGDWSLWRWGDEWVERYDGA